MTLPSGHRDKHEAADRRSRCRHPVALRFSAGPEIISSQRWFFCKTTRVLVAATPFCERRPWSRADANAALERVLRAGPCPGPFWRMGGLPPGDCGRSHNVKQIREIALVTSQLKKGRAAAFHWADKLARRVPFRKGAHPQPLGTADRKGKPISFLVRVGSVIRSLPGLRMASPGPLPGSGGSGRLGCV